MIGAIIQARMGSTRLPGKNMKKVNGKPLLWFVVERLRECKNLDEIVVATTDTKKDDVIEEFCKKNNIKCFRGSEENVLERYYQAASANNLETIVRITADCPLIDPITVDKAIDLFRESKTDYVSNVASRSFPRGLDVEVFSFQALEKAFSEAEKDMDKEHVTHYIYNNKDKFKTTELKATDHLFRPELRLCVDTENDFKVVEEILSPFEYPMIEIMQVIDFVDSKPELLKTIIAEEDKYRDKSKVKQRFLK